MKIMTSSDWLEYWSERTKLNEIDKFERPISLAMVELIEAMILYYESKKKEDRLWDG